MMADAIAQGIHDVDPAVAVKVFNVSRQDKNDILTSVFRSKGILVGSSTMNNVMMPKIAGMLEEITGLRFRAKKAGAFGSYGWNGGAVDRIHSRLTDAGFETAVGLKAKWRPDGKAMQLCREHGQCIAKQWALAPLTTTFNTINVEKETQTIEEPVILVEPSVELEKTAKEVTSSKDAKQCMLCSVCNWVYDPEIGEQNQGVEPNTPWSLVPDDFLCPECHLGKDVFVEIN